jgi:hypothetical protein
MASRGWARVSPFIGATGADVFWRCSRARAGGPSRGRFACVDDALDRVERTEGRWFEAELHPIGGELPLLTPAARFEAEASF